MTINWIHLDFKGLMPAQERLLAWVDWLSQRGFNGVLLEYEDRIAWRTWPHTFRPGLTLDQWRAVIAAIRQRGMQVIPLIQTHGHLEWLLKHPAWATWRENGCHNELCPQVDAVRPAILAWLDEVVAIHEPGLQYLHIGGDETWNLATCPRCREIADQSPDGKLGVYLPHLEWVTKEVVARGLRPLIWADAFWREKRLDLVHRLPKDVILCDWRYEGSGPWQTVEQLGHAGNMVLGSSAIRCSYDLSECVSNQRARLDNVLAWPRHKGIAGMIHTVWGRSRSLLPPYGPWEGWLPGFLAAGDPEAWSNHPLNAWTAKLDSALSGSAWTASQLADELQRQSFSDPWVDACRRWWLLALRWHAILQASTTQSRTLISLKSVHESIGLDPDYVNLCRAALNRIDQQLQQWEADVQAYFDLQQLGDAREFLASRADIVRAQHSVDWAHAIIPPAPARSRH